MADLPLTIKLYYDEYEEEPSRDPADDTSERIEEHLDEAEMEYYNNMDNHSMEDQSLIELQYGCKFLCGKVIRIQSAYLKGDKFVNNGQHYIYFHGDSLPSSLKMLPFFICFITQIAKQAAKSCF